MLARIGSIQAAYKHDLFFTEKNHTRCRLLVLTAYLVSQQNGVTFEITGVKSKPAVIRFRQLYYKTP
jgi:hypothetical protein